MFEKEDAFIGHCPVLITFCTKIAYHKIGFAGFEFVSPKTRAPQFCVIYRVSVGRPDCIESTVTGYLLGDAAICSHLSRFANSHFASNRNRSIFRPTTIRAPYRPPHLSLFALPIGPKHSRKKHPSFLSCHLQTRVDLSRATSVP